MKMKMIHLHDQLWYMCSGTRFTLYSDEKVNWKIIDQREDIVFTLDLCIKGSFTLGLHLRKHHHEMSSLTLCHWRQQHKHTEWSEPILGVFH